MNNNFELAKEFFYKGEENYSKKNFSYAEQNFLISLNFLPNKISTLINLGLTKLKLRKIDEAEEIICKINSLLKVSSKEEGNIENFLNFKSLFYGESNNFDKSIQTLEQLIIIKNISKNKLSEYLSYMGIAHSKIGNYFKNIDLQQKSLKLNPNNIQAKFNLGLQYLKLENFKDGWSFYENRLVKNSLDTKLYPKNIKDIKNKKVLIKPEQGFGDIIQFSRFIPLLENYTDDIDFLIPKQFGNLFKFSKIKTIFEKKKNYDYEIYLCSLPFLLNVFYSDLKNI